MKLGSHIVSHQDGNGRWEAERVVDHPLLDSTASDSIGTNIQGPSVVQTPEWMSNRLGNYYMYFAHHKGSFIRLAYADHIEGPWTVHRPGALHIDQTPFPTRAPSTDMRLRKRAESERAASSREYSNSAHEEMSTPHIASPDVHVDNEQHRVVMFFHGLESYGRQVSRVAVSEDGLTFTAHPRIVGRTYFRAFSYGGQCFALAMPGQLYRRIGNIDEFEPGPLLFNPDMRHCALLVRGSFLDVLWTQVGEAPERIYVSSIDLSEPFESWRESERYELLRPTRPWEGANEPVHPSVRGLVSKPVNQLRDPAVLVDDEDVYLFYAVAGENGIGLAKLRFHRTNERGAL